MIIYLINLYETDNTFILKILLASVYTRNNKILEYILDNLDRYQIPTERFDQEFFEFFSSYTQFIDDNLCKKLEAGGFYLDKHLDQIMKSLLERYDFARLKLLTNRGCNIMDVLNKL